MTSRIKEVWTLEECNRRHKWVARMSALIVTVLGLQMSFIGWSIQAAGSAASKAETASMTANEATIRVESNWQSSLRQLSGLRDALKEIQASQVKSDDRIIDELKYNRALVEKMMLEHHERNK